MSGRSTEEQALHNTDVSRRDFVAGSAAALSLAPLLGAKSVRARQNRTLFFNLSHLPSVNEKHHLFMAGKTYEMERVGSGHPALMQALRGNTFLRALPSAAITHVVQGIELPAEAVTTGYAFTPTSGGEWEMPSFYMTIPQQGLAAAYQQLSATRQLGQPLPMSAKRMKYGLPAAASLQEFLDEQMLLDTTNMAAAVVNLHPELLSVVPNSAGLIQTQFISPRTVFGISNYLESAGPAQPQTSTQSNINSWGTLVPFTDDNGQPLINNRGSNKGLILYDVQWSSTLKTVAAPALKSALRGAKNYVPSANGSGSQITLGVDATAGRSNIPDSAVLGTIWTRSDGQTSIDQSPGTPGSLLSASSAHYTLTNDSLNYGGYSASLAAEVTTIKLSFVNSYLRYLGVYAEFYKGDQVVPVSQLPTNISGIPVPGLNTDNAVFLGFIAPEFTLFGIPVLASTLSISFPFPTGAASTALILASGLGIGSHTFPDTELVGVVMTMLFNFVIPALMIGLGIAQELDLVAKAIVIPFFQTLVNEFVTMILDLQSVVQSPQMVANVLWKTLVKAEVGPGIGVFVSEILIPFLTTTEVIDFAEDAIPIAGLIIQAISIAGALAEMAETTAEVVSSPWTYQYQLVGTQDLPVTISPETNQQFPSAAASCTVTAIFNDGTPVVQQIAVPSSPGPSISATFRAVPLGGQVTIHVGLYSVDGTQVGHGNAGPLANDGSAPPTVTFTQDKLPITTGTQYFHKQKTSLDAQGNHVWACGPAPAVVAPVGFCENQPGNICALHGITASSASNNVGYAWQSYSTASCSSGGSGQLDQLVNIPTQNDTSGNAQTGYAFIPCALTPGTHMIYDPSARADSNFYLDPGSNVLRQIQLNPPAFADPRVNPQTTLAAWGKLNLPSADLLLHPAGTIVSINSANHKLESLKVPANAVTDDEAGVSLLASIYGGFGTRPGLLDSPTVVTVNAEGVVLVLEGGNNRIHALDIYGNPVQLFTKQSIPYFLNLTATGGSGTQYLDIAAEFTGFIYVLSSSTSDQATYQYRLDIYASDQTGTQPVSTTMGFNAAKVAVDYWRNVYSLNYEVLRLPNQMFPANGVTEPSISQWIPTEPPPCSVGGTPPPGPPHHRKPHPRRPHETSRLLRRRDLFRV